MRIEDLINRNSTVKYRRKQSPYVEVINFPLTFNSIISSYC